MKKMPMIHARLVDANGDLITPQKGDRMHYDRATQTITYYQPHSSLPLRFRRTPEHTEHKLSFEFRSSSENILELAQLIGVLTGYDIAIKESALGVNFTFMEPS